MSTIRIKARRFIARYFSSLVELFYSIKIKNTNFKNGVVIILTPGKVGSSSVYYTLKHSIDLPVYHIHQFSKSGIKSETQKFLKSARKSRPLHLIVSKLIRKKIDKINPPLYIVTIVREPVSRFISSFFQNTELYKEELENRSLEIDTTKALELLYKNFQSDICKDVEGWFDKEIKGNFEIDVFETPFDTNKKYNIIRHDNVHHLMMRMEDLDGIFSEATKELIGLDSSISLQNANEGGKKHYAKAYSSVKNKIKLPPNTLEDIVGSKYFKHFYTGKEKGIIEKWSDNT